jgi:hypothetical protein
MQAGDTVDEVRITAGDGSRDGTQLVATYPVHVVGGASPAAAHAEPDWVTRLNRIDQAAQRAAYEQRMNTPTTPGDVVLFSGFMLAMLGLGLLGIAAPGWAMARWRGGWRVAAAAPAALMGFVVLRVIVETAADPTSHNLWPFEILQAGTVSVIAIAILYFARRRAGAR